MNRQDIVKLYRYNRWANERLIDVIATLSTETTTRDLGGSFRTIRDLLAHIVAAEWVWLERCGGHSPSTIPDWVGSGDVSVLHSHLTDVETRCLDWIESLPESSLSTPISFRYISGVTGTRPLGDILLHVVNHATYHRGQVVSMLRLVGAVPPATDFLVFMDASSPPTA